MDRDADAARLLLSARRDPSQLVRVFQEPLRRPKTVEQAVGAQRGVMAELGEIGGWKVGSPPPDGAVQLLAPAALGHPRERPAQRPQVRL